MIKGFIIGFVVMYVISFVTADDFNEFYWIYTPLVLFFNAVGWIGRRLEALLVLDSYWYLYKKCGLNPFHIKVSDLIALPREHKEYLYNHARLKSWKKSWKNLLDKEEKVR